MESLKNKLTSRKFLLALFAQVVGLIVLFVPEHTDAVEAAASNFGALALMALTAGGWIKAEGELDNTRTAIQAQKEDR